MNFKFPIRTLLAGLLISTTVLLVYQRRNLVVPTARYKVQWFEKTMGVVVREPGVMTWQHHDACHGSGAYLILEPYNTGQREVPIQDDIFLTFQFPELYNTKEIINFKPIPYDKTSVTFPGKHDLKYSVMVPGEFTARQYVDGMTDKHDSTARITILDMNHETIHLHIVVNANIQRSHRKIDLNQTFIIRRQENRSK